MKFFHPLTNIYLDLRVVYRLRLYRMIFGWLAAQEGDAVLVGYHCVIRSVDSDPRRNYGVEEVVVVRWVIWSLDDPAARRTNPALGSLGDLWGAV